MTIRGKRLLLLGDSLAEGLSAQMSDLVMDLGGSFASSVISGISTVDFASQGLARRNVEASVPSHVVIVLGTNDLSRDPESLKSAVVDVIAQCGAISPLPTISWWTPPHFQSDRLNALTPHVRDIIREVTTGTAGTSALDSVPVTEFAEKSGAFHFTARGYKWWAEAGLAATLPQDMIGPPQITVVSLPPPSAGQVEFDTTWGTDVKLGRVPWGYMVALAMEESGLNPRVQNPSGATGLWQIMPSNLDSYNRATGERLGRQDLFDPEINKRVAAHMMNKVLERWDSEPYLLADWFSPRFIGLFAMAWNMGPGAVEEATAKLKAARYRESQVNIETVWHASPDRYRHPDPVRNPEGRTRLRFAHKVVDNYFKGPVGFSVPMQELARGPRGGARTAQAGMGGAGAILALGVLGAGIAVLAGGKKEKRTARLVQKVERMRIEKPASGGSRRSK